MSRRNHKHTMDALIGKPLYSNVMGEPTAVVDVIGGGTFGGGVFTPPEDRGNTGVSTTPTRTTATYTAPTRTANAITPIGEVATSGTATGGGSTTTTTSGSGTTTTTYVADPLDTGKPIKTPIPTPSPVVVVQTPFISPMPLISGGFGGGGGASSSASKVVAEKPNFIKKNILPILLVGSAIYVIIKKPI